jgi:hypothetical protein
VWYRFRNISRIMDCVTCEKCRVWGKLQILGIGTAIKILLHPAADHLVTPTATVATNDAHLGLDATSCDVLETKRKVGNVEPGNKDEDANKKPRDVNSSSSSSSANLPCPSITTNGSTGAGPKASVPPAGPSLFGEYDSD